MKLLVMQLGGSPCHHSMARPRVADGRDGLQQCIVWGCIYSAFKASMKRIQNIVNIQHTDNNKYIKFKLLNIIIKLKI
jgi:NADH:ubiquinone oxidoreductase subunit E